MYIIIENGYEYNDEIFYKTNGYDICKIFHSKDRAEEECKRLNVDMFRRDVTCIREFTYGDWYEVSSHDREYVQVELSKLFPDQDFSNKQFWLFWKVPKCSDEILMKVMALFDRIEFYSVGEYDYND